MAFTNFTTDVENIKKLPDEPSYENGYTAQSVKASFDKAAVDLKSFLNNTLLTELAQKTASTNIGSNAISGVLADNNIYSQLCELKKQLDSIVNAQFPNGSIDKVKLSGETQNILDTLGSRFAIYKLVGNYSFTVPRTGVYKVTVVGGGAAGHSNGGGMSGGCGIKWLNMTKGAVSTITVGSGGKTTSQPMTVGGNSSFGDIIAQGGFADGMVFDIFPSCTNADIIIKGRLQTPLFMSEDSSRRWGGDSYIGNGARSNLDAPGIGAGGYGFINGGENFFTNGGDGAVIIEFTGCA